MTSHPIPEHDFNKFDGCVTRGRSRHLVNFIVHIDAFEVITRFDDLINNKLKPVNNNNTKKYPG